MTETSSTHAAHVERVATYYDDMTRLAKFIGWFDQSDMIHFGYWDASVRTHQESLVAMSDQLLQGVGFSRGMHVLDAGCGIGGMALKLARQHGVQVTGVNICESQLEQARTLAAREGLQDRVSFQNADYNHLPFPDATFDVVTMVESLIYTPDKAPPLREMCRVLKPGGRLLIADGFLTRDPLDDAAAAEVKRSGECWGGAVWISKDATDRTLREIGFSEVNIRDVTHHVEKSLKRLLWTCRVLVPLARPFVEVGIIPRNYFPIGMAGIHQWEIHRKGYWCYALVQARKAG
ncbi:MAG: methyltransferase domain-containing protein [Myxococcota bacterium]